MDLLVDIVLHFILGLRSLENFHLDLIELGVKALPFQREQVLLIHVLVTICYL